MPLRLKKPKNSDIWHYSGTVAGRRLRGSTKTTRRAEAEKVAHKIEADHLERDRNGPAATLTFAQAAIKYRAVMGEKRYLRLVEDHWKDTLVKNISRGAVKDAAIKLMPTASAATRNRGVIVPTLAVINYAASLDLCPPMKADRFPVVTKVREPVTEAWLDAFMAHSSAHLGALACFMYATGARISEALGVKWQDLDLSAATVKIRMGKLGGKERVSNLPPRLVAAIAGIAGEREADKQVFPYSSYRSCADPWEVAIKRAGIKRLTPHCCRHGFATTLLHRGVDVMTVADLGGWADAMQVVRTYGHAQKNPRLNNLLFSGTKQANASVEQPEAIENKTVFG